MLDDDGRDGDAVLCLPSKELLSARIGQCPVRIDGDSGFVVVQHQVAVAGGARRGVLQFLLGLVRLGALADGLAGFLGRLLDFLVYWDENSHNAFLVRMLLLWLFLVSLFLFVCLGLAIFRFLGLVVLLIVFLLVVLFDRDDCGSNAMDFQRNLPTMSVPIDHSWDHFALDGVVWWESVNIPDLRGQQCCGRTFVDCLPALVESNGTGDCVCS
mmetsp:Transcript_16450/g.45902  ORF Transcript_16450/g.45902 Transcript_16450/m.45902 type:complete len:213 (-) Transcript_16450:370-1008(-)